MIDWCSALLAQNLRPVGLFLAVYDPSNTLSRVLAYVTVVPPMSVVALFGVLVASRSGRVLQLWLTLVLSFALNEALKHAIAQPRPAQSWVRGYGMPSSHAACVSTSFAFVECLLFANVWSLPPLTRAVWRIGMLALIGAVVAARASIYVHSLEQCFVGVGIGVVYALLSFWLVPNSVVRAGERLLERTHNALIGSQPQHQQQQQQQQKSDAKKQ
jgi:dolichyldiphosphatase